jgi:ketosteroid isomerase-like protein
MARKTVPTDNDCEAIGGWDGYKYSPGRVCENDGALLPKERRVLERRIEEVTKANQKFYEAFESLDISKMDEVWAHLDYVTCVHPGWTLRSEWPAVRDSWVLIFNNTFSMKFELTESMVQVAGDMAWVICVENITSQQSDEPQQARVLATNLFERIGDKWLMIHHHGSPVMR